MEILIRRISGWDFQGVDGNQEEPSRPDGARSGTCTFVVRKGYETKRTRLVLDG